MPQKKRPHLAGYCKAQKKVVMWCARQGGLSKVGRNVRQHATQFFCSLNRVARSDAAMPSKTKHTTELACGELNKRQFG